MATCTTASRSAPRRVRVGWVRTRRCTYRSPAGPPRRPPAPRPGRRRVEPSSTPAGTSTTKVRSSRRRPSPRQSGHGRGDLLAGTAATRARRGGDHLAQDRLADPADLAGTLAVAAVIGRGAGPGPDARAGLAGLGQADGQLVVHPEHRLGELQVDGRLGVLALAGPASGPRRPYRPSRRRPEERVEEVAEAPAPNPAKGSRAPVPRRPRAPHARRRRTCRTGAGVPGPGGSRRPG